MQGAARAAWRAEQGVARTPHLATTPRAAGLVAHGHHLSTHNCGLPSAVVAGPPTREEEVVGASADPQCQGSIPQQPVLGPRGPSSQEPLCQWGGGGGWGGRRSPGWHGPPLLSRHAEALGAPGWAGRAAILEKRHGFRSAARDADRLKPAPIPLIELGDIGFMELDFLMTKNYLCGQTKTNGAQSPLWRPFGPQSPGGRLIAPGDGVIGGRGTESPFMLFLG